ncbi:MAG: tetratricopeptide repeat protein [Spirochaetia bacterium]|nr:tetratricopeptide repeat protein [Spirochaetia bacterium]
MARIFMDRRILFIALPLSIFSACSGRDFSEADLKRFEEAQALYRNRKFEEADKIAGELRSKKPANVEAGVLHAKIKLYTRDFKGAEEILKEVRKKNDSSPYVLLWLGRVIMVDPKRQEEACAIMREVLQNDPENFNAHYLMGRCLENQKKMKAALLEYQTALGMEYQVSKVHSHMARLFSDLSMNDRAKKHADRVKALGIDPVDIASLDETASAGGAKKK